MAHSALRVEACFASSGRSADLYGGRRGCI